MAGAATAKLRELKREYEEGFADCNNLWYEYSWNNCPSNDHSSSHLTQSLHLHYLEKTKHGWCPWI